MIGILLAYPRLIAAGVGIAFILMIGGGIYVKGRSDAAHKIEVAQLRVDKAALEARIVLTNKLVKADAVQSAKDQAALEQYEGEVNELLNKLEAADTVCLTGPDTDSLRSLWKD